MSLMVHKLGEELRKNYSLEAFPSNHKAGVHTLNNAKGWLEEMDEALTSKERELDRINEELQKDYLEKEKEQELWEQKQELQDQKDELESQREELDELKKRLIESQVEKEERALETESGLREPAIIYPKREIIMPQEEVTVEIPRPKTKPLMEEIKEQIPKVKETLAGAGRFIEGIPKALFPEKKNGKKKNNFEKFKKESKIEWI
jgi:chromosome segregation ATPase